MKRTILSLAVFILLLAQSISYAEAKPSRRALIEEGEQALQKKTDQHRQNAVDAMEIEYKEKHIPVLGFSFSYPEYWTVGITRDLQESSNRTDIIDGDVVRVYDEQFKEGHSVEIYSKEMDQKAVLQDAWNIWNERKRQPDDEKLFEYYNLVYIRELENLVEREIEYLGKKTLEIEHTSSKSSKFWKHHIFMFPWGNRIYTIEYKSERGYEDRFQEAFYRILDSFTFHSPEPGLANETEEEEEKLFIDVDSSHPYSKAITRVRELGIVGGYNDNSYKPDANINRAEFIKILTSEPLVSGEQLAACENVEFSDVSPNAWFATHVCMGKQLGLIGGYPDGTFGPEKLISFTEAAKILAGFFSEEPLQQSEPWYDVFVSYLSSKKAIPLSIASLTSPLNRGEMAEIIYRLFDGIETESLNSEDFIE